MAGDDRGVEKGTGRAVRREEEREKRAAYKDWTMERGTGLV